MRRTPIAVVLAALLAIGCDRPTPPADTAKSATMPPKYTPEQFYRTTSFTGASFSADESRILLSSDATGVFNVYAQPVAGGSPVKLTDSTTDSTFAVSYFPADDRFLYTADEGGNELNHLYVVGLDGLSRDLTPGEKLKAIFIGWSGDNQSFFVATNERDARMYDVYRYATADYTRQRIFENDGRFLPGGASRDGKFLAVSEVVSNTRTDLWLVDTSSGALTRVTPEVDVSHFVFTFTPDSKQLVYGTNEIGEYVEAWTYDIATGARTALIKADWDVMYVAFSDGGRYRLHALNADADTAVTLTDLQSGTAVEIPNLSKGDIRRGAFARSEKRLAFYIASDVSPANLYVHELGTTTSRVLTSSLASDMREADLVESTVVRYPSFDGTAIPAILFKPKSATPGARAPAVVYVHGGPGGQTRRGWDANVQALVNHGYAVLGVNNRGSSGYGKTFFHADDRKHGDVDLKDCVHGKKYLQSLDWVDGERIAIMGGSYGGYMVAAALAFTPQEFTAGIDVFGVTNWVRTLESIPSWWVAQRAGLYGELGDPATDKERLTAISPLFHAQQIVRPLLVIQGKNDPRVLQRESDELVAAVRANNVPVDYVVFDDEGHGFTKKANRVTALGKFLEFLDQHVAPSGGAAIASTKAPSA